MIPKLIWTFWDSENLNLNLPEFIQLCVNSWKHFNDDYKITVLNMINYKNYIDVDIEKLRHFNKSKPALTADFIRLSVLQKYGGVWMDASIICLKPLKFKETTEFFAYYLDNYGVFGNWKYPLIESWFIAAAKDNLFINEWYNELVINSNKYETLPLYVLTSGVEAPHGYFTEYFTIHIAAQKTCKKLDKQGKLTNLVLKNAWKDGPLLDIEKTFPSYAEGLCKIDFSSLKTPIIKLNGPNRREILKVKEFYNCIIKKIEFFSNEDTSNLEDIEDIEDIGQDNLDNCKHIFRQDIYAQNIAIVCLFLVFFVISVTVGIIYFN